MSTPLFLCTQYTTMNEYHTKRIVTQAFGIVHSHCVKTQCFINNCELIKNLRKTNKQIISKQ